MRRFAVAVALLLPLVAGAANESPVAAHRFAISVDGVQIAEFADAKVNLSAQPPTVVLTKGRESAGKLEAWHVAAGGSGSPTARKQAFLVEHDAIGKPVARFKLTNAWPSSVQRGGGSIPMEKVTLTCERIERVSR